MQDAGEALDPGPRVRGYEVHVLAGLPVELWSVIASFCADDRASTVALAAVCRALRVAVARLAVAGVERARASVDRMVDAWERLAADGDRAWAAGIDCERCAGMSDDEGRTIRTVGTSTHVVRRYVVYGLAANGTLCDDCAIETVGCLHNIGLAWAAPVVVERVDLDAPHVWGDFGAIAPSGPVDDARFIVPGGLLHLINERAAARLAALAPVPPTYFFHDESTRLAALPSVRSWLPVGLAHVEGHRYRGLFVCCDEGHPMWGAVAAACVDAGRTAAGDWRTAYSEWWTAYPHMDALMTAYREQRNNDGDVIDIISWATDVAFDRDAPGSEIIR
ncbi:hypothetical protein psal_cds_1389 [Pandoravirus salinus]|uniref:Uncharacterized protein n=1 Tax=Pandoravirus salinus TaxID=1349410 RepID=S4VYM4_9VIRU|nr:hypothetical protein psal_cds_1389 [Pandoravirus salinus]AGO85804.1 hypothetical protein psal_cds_1389 [Pandoravirus salinus]